MSTITYQVWEGGNAIGGFESEAAAITFVREILVRDGPRELNELSLWALSSDRRLWLLADGGTLLRRIHARKPT